MIIKYYFQNNNMDTVDYSFSGEVITIKLNNQIDDFDFTDLPDGVLQVGNIETDLKLNLIVGAKRENGILTVELIKFFKDKYVDDIRVEENHEPVTIEVK